MAGSAGQAMTRPHGESGATGAIELIFALPLAVSALLYLVGALSQTRRGRPPWPLWRTASWMLGLALVLSTLVGPLAAAAHDDFVLHMLSHLIVGMLAPILLVVAAPVTLALRTLEITQARRLSGLLRSPLPRFLIHPVVSAVINVGSLWVLYTTPAFTLMMSHPLWHAVILMHFLVAGYLFAASIVGTDPAPHRTSFRFRLAVLVLAEAGHSILAKAVYVAAPPNVTPSEARDAAQLMYYGGDLIELVLIALFCAKWYVAARPRARSVLSPIVQLHSETGFPLNEGESPGAPHSGARVSVRPLRWRERPPSRASHSRAAPAALSRIVAPIRPTPMPEETP